MTDDTRPAPPSRNPAAGSWGMSERSLTMHVEVGDGAVMTIVDPKSFKDGGPEWIMRYGNPIPVRYQIAGLIDSYDYLLSADINLKEAIRRLRLMRKARATNPSRGGASDE